MKGLSFAPFIDDFRGYGISSFRHDLIAAISVALMALPQSFAYAFVAELPPSMGVFAAIFGTLITAAFGSSRYLVSGPTNVVAILILSGTSEILSVQFREVTGAVRDQMAFNIVLQLTLLVGIFQIIGASIRMGRLTQFASRSVLIAYVAGAAVAILASQLFPFLGIRDQPGYQPIYQQLWFWVTHLNLTHLPTLYLGIMSLVGLALIGRFLPKWPSALIVFLFAGGVVYFFHLSPEARLGLFDVQSGQQVQKITLLHDFWPNESEIPGFYFGFLNPKTLLMAVPLAFAISLVSALEATGAGRLFARSGDKPYSDNQEIFGLGLSNLISSFLGAMPSSGSVTRTSLNHMLHAATRFSALMSSLFVLLFAILLGSYVAKIPLTALAALMIYTSVMMVNFKQLYTCLRATKTDAFVVAITFISSCIFTLDVALYVGVILSVVLYLRQASVPYLAEYTFNPIGKLRPMEEEDERLDPRIAIIDIEGELFFGGAEILQTRLRHIADEEEILVIILQMFNARHIDATSCLALRTLHRNLKNQGKVLLASGFSSDVKRVMKNAGLIEEMGKERFFPYEERGPSEATRAAYAFAKTLLI